LTGSFLIRPFSSGNPRAIGQAGGLVIDAYIAVRGVQGEEIKISDDLRIAPTGNRTGHRRVAHAKVDEPILNLSFSSGVPHPFGFAF
jgi:hypothetical protein